MRPQDIAGATAGAAPLRVCRSTELGITRFGFWLAATVLALNLFIAAFVGLTVQQGRLQYEERAATTTQNLATALENEIAGIIRVADLALQEVADEYGHRSAVGDIDRRKFKAFIDRIKARLPYVNAIRLADAQGGIMYGSDVPAGLVVDISDREYFRRVRDHADAGLVMSKPQKSRVNDKWVVVLARRLDGGGGRFAGVAFMPITVESLTQTLSKINVGRKGSIALRGEDLGIIARYPQPESGMESGSGIVSRDFGVLVEAGHKAGTLHAAMPPDGVDRMLSYRRVADYPLHIVVGLASEEYLAQWRITTMRALIAAAVFFVVTLTLSWLVFRYWKQLKFAGAALEHQAHTDFLTGLANRRFFLESAAHELARAVRYQHAVSLLMLDIDHFKRINDTYGHMSGDAVLQKLAVLCTSALRAVDLMGRWGGEEFAIVLPETGLERAREVAERIRQSVAAGEIALPQGLPLKLTVSIGVATHADGEDNIDMLIDRADQALYRAKNLGRNRVCADATGPHAARGRIAGD